MTLRLSWGWLSAVTCLIALPDVATAQSGRATSTNFIVSAPTQELAQKFADAAEYYRVEKAREWLGRELPAWPRPCPLRVVVTMGNAGGATTFTFEQDNSGRSYVASRKMEIKGKLSQLMDSVLPHEITHTIFADHFGRPVPRWADEGGSVLSENDDERTEHDIKCRQILNAGRGIKLRVLFAMKEYPDDMIVTYAEGYSISQYLIDQGGRKKFLEFVGLGMRNGSRNWEDAVREVYGMNSVDDLEQKWIDSLHQPRTVAARTTPNGGGTTPTGRVKSELRSSAAPGVPLLDPPIVARGAAPELDRTERPSSPRVATRPVSPASPPPVSLLGPPETVRR